MKQFVEQLRPRIRLDNPLQKINTFILEQNLPKEVFGGLPYRAIERLSVDNSFIYVCSNVSNVFTSRFFHR